MEAQNILNIATRADFRKWLNENHARGREC